MEQAAQLAALIRPIVGCSLAGQLAGQLIEEHGSVAALLDEDPWPKIEPQIVAEHLREIGRSVRLMLAEQIVMRPILASSKALRDYLRVKLAHQRTEQVIAIYLDCRCMLLREEVASQGSQAGATLPVSAIVRRALQLGASGLIIVHNHPSGDPAPSKQDVQVTGQLHRAAKAVDVALYDHLIIGAAGVTSFAERGLVFGSG